MTVRWIINREGKYMYNFNEWEDLKATNNNTKIEAEVWNRKIKFEKSLFPTSVAVGEKEILYAPIELKAFFGKEEGKWENHNVIMHENSDKKAVYTVSQSTNDIMVNADITIEFDGFIKVDFRIIPFWNPAWILKVPKMPTLSMLYINIPMKNEYASLMHYWPNCESGVNLSQKVINSHATPFGETKLAFKPYVWLGWEYGGLGVSCESDKNFELKNADECIIIDRNEEFTNIKISLLEYLPKEWQERADVWGNNLKPIFYSFALQATPVKEFEKNNLKDWRAFHLYDVPKFPIFDEVKGKGDTLLEKIAQKGVKWLILHEDWTIIQNYGMPENEEIFKRFVSDCHKLGIKLMVYFGYEVSSLYPGFNDIADLYLNKNINGNFVGGWQREPMQRDYTVCYRGDYSEIMIKRVEHVMDTYGVDGIYTDGTYVPWECANETHGCGYRDDEGKLHYTYPIYAVREHVKKLYKAVHSRGGRIDTHQSSCCLMPTLAFADSYFDGENIQPFLKEDISNLKTDAFRAEFMGLNMGIPCHFISYTSEAYTMRLISGSTLIHNVLPRANRIEDLDYISRLWKIYDDFGIEEAKWCPYWEEQGITVENPDTYLSYYKKADALLIIITSYDKDINEIKINLDGEYQKAEDLLDEEKLFVSGSSLLIPIEYANVKLVKIW